MLETTHHIGIALLGIELRKAILRAGRLHVGEARRVHCAVVVSEEESSCVGLIDVVVEIATACYR